MTLADAGAAYRNELAVVRQMTTDDAAWSDDYDGRPLECYYRRL